MITQLKLALKHRLKPYLKPVVNIIRQRRKSAAMPIESGELGTHYHDHIDRAKLKSLRPYKVKPSNLKLEDVKRNVNYNFYSSYGPDFKQKDCLAMSVDGPVDYERLLNGLKEIKGLSSDTFAHYLPERELVQDEIACVIRHDLDGDLVAALQQAEIEKKLGFKSSFFVLHTAPYYGLFDPEGMFLRNDECIDSYKTLQELGHEVALHTDGMLVYQDQGRDGAAALRDEIAWLRKHGINLTGTTAHNSWSVYGVENFAIFAGKDKGKWQGKRAVTQNGKWAPIGVLNESEMGLEYEANELIWQTKTPIFYAALRSQNVWRVDFINFPKELIEQESKFGRLVDFKNKFVSTDDVLDLAKMVQAPCYFYLVVHPMHYGMRGGYDQKPWHPDSAIRVENKNSVMVANQSDDGSVISTAVNVKNEFDTLDRGLDCYLSATKKIIVLGDGNLATEKVSADSKYSQVCAQFFGRAIRIVRTAAISYATEKPTLNDLVSAYEAISNKAESDCLVISASSDNPEFNLIMDWVVLLKSTRENIVFILEDLSKTEFKHGSEIIDIFAKDVFSNYLGSGAIFFDGQEKSWTAQGHHLIGKAICELLFANFQEEV